METHIMKYSLFIVFFAFVPACFGSELSKYELDPSQHTLDTTSVMTTGEFQDYLLVQSDESGSVEGTQEKPEDTDTTDMTEYSFSTTHEDERPPLWDEEKIQHALEIRRRLAEKQAENQKFWADINAQRSPKLSPQQAPALPVRLREDTPYPARHKKGRSSSKTNSSENQRFLKK